jgi:flavin-dependent dehydrogenase
MGDVEPVLKSLGVLDRCSRANGFEASRVTSAWGSSILEATTSRGIDGPWGWRIDRRRFDTMLVEAAEGAGALVYCGLRVRLVERARSGWRVTMCGKTSTPTVVGARYLVDATGRPAWLARRLDSTSRRIDRQVALFASYSQPLADTSLVVESASDGWWYSVSFADSHTIAVYLTDADLLPRGCREEFFLDRLRHSAHTRERLCSLGQPVLKCVPADTSYRDPCAGNGWLAVGDAAFALDPLSGFGIRHALESGLVAANALRQAASGQRRALSRYQEHSNLDFFQQLRWRAYYYAQESRWPSSTFWKRRTALAA